MSLIHKEKKMKVKRLEELEASKVKERLFGLCLKKGEKRRLYELCIKHHITITYPELFDDDTHYYLWGISENGIGLIGTIIMNYLECNGIIFNSLDELEKHLAIYNK